MDKQAADNLITAYLPKLYGFAIKKAFSYAEAEELCADIVTAVYTSLRKAEEIVNIEGYIWRISEHTYAKFVAHRKRHEGISIDGIAMPFYDEDTRLEAEEEMHLLRREIAFLTEKRRQIVFWFYYENKSIAAIAKSLAIPEGTVKWHLNKARHDLKEGLSMKRQIGTLGLSPVTASDLAHGGQPGTKGGPDYYLGDKLNLNIVYSVYFEPRSAAEIAEELGVTPVFIEDKITFLEENGFLVRQKDGKFTTYVVFKPRTASHEREYQTLTMRQEAAKVLVEEYVPLVREAIKNVTDVYIPSGNRELFEAAMIYWAVADHCHLPFEKDLSRYKIRTTDGGDYFATVSFNETYTDPDFVPPIDFPPYNTCGCMMRGSGKYKSVGSIAWNNRLCSRKGGWMNNLYTDYDYVYELMCGVLDESPVHADKLARLRELGYIDENNNIRIMIVKGDHAGLEAHIPPLDDAIKGRFIDYALESAAQIAKDYPPQMQDLVMCWSVTGFISNPVAMMVLDILYENGTFKPLTEQEKITANLLMFCDRLP